MPISFNFLPAGSGDAILIAADNFNILIDGGNNRMKQHNTLVKKLKEIKSKDEQLDWIVLTHIDEDHINGLIKILRRNNNLKIPIKNIWFNAFNNYKVDAIITSSEISQKQLITFEQLVDEVKQSNIGVELCKNISIERFSHPIKINKNIKISLLSPTSEILDKLYREYVKEKKSSNISAKNKDSDYNYSIEDLGNRPDVNKTSLTNKSSISFILTYQNKFNFLLLADADIDTVISSLKNQKYTKTNPLKVNFVKLAHHGSKFNLNKEFLELVETDIFIISSNISNHGHPHKETLAKIILHYQPKPVKFIFNNSGFYKIFNQEEIDKYQFELLNTEKDYLTFG
ncbi:ComEC/Rec2 family competence protein [Candidatus Venteria ishoeyi]|uniref:Metallo-beta-lactamase superfamily protein n=1 Tax=Candidatus Venteria ishoeyi TaxID=1899563 RepID=A0A1H6F604_9GAMM|nr:MBL fold metallo-hydrolase [Candidatus Venteria ishoeyi]SEH05580.1 Metallo-beta-lactamase superfamily protein [Candidatus Venteria ishoeyi]